MSKCSTVVSDGEQLLGVDGLKFKVQGLKFEAGSWKTEVGSQKTEDGRRRETEDGAGSRPTTKN